MFNKKLLVKWYVLVAFSLGILGLIDTLIAHYSIPKLAYSYFISTIFLVFFFANIFILFYFIHHRIKPIFYILPIYHILLYITFTVIGIIITIKEINSINFAYGLTLTAGIISILEILFCIFLFQKYTLFHEKNKKISL